MNEEAFFRGVDVRAGHVVAGPAASAPEVERLVDGLTARGVHRVKQGGGGGGVDQLTGGDGELPALGTDDLGVTVVRAGAAGVVRANRPGRCSTCCYGTTMPEHGSVSSSLSSQTLNL